MIRIISGYLKRLYDNDIIRYIFFGGLTTLVNLISYTLLRGFMDYNIANFISIVLAILFAYIVNSRFVFRSKARTTKQRLSEFIKFIGARLSTMIIEILGVFVFVDLLQINDLIGKVIIQFVVLILNYIFSKLIVFKNK
ncbi:MAG: GtrA family protein [Clostridiales bacterium]|nr:GtrA family protein [Clostridiales bacterium]